jgi:hypothetical protein
MISFSQHVIGWKLRKIVNNLGKHKNEIPIVCHEKLYDRWR